MVEDGKTGNVQATPYHEDVSDATSIRIQHQMMCDWIKEMTFRGQAAQVVYASQSRYFAQQHQLWGSTPEETPLDLQRQSLPLPLVSIQENGIDPDPERWFTGIWSALMTGPTTISTRIYAKDDRSEMWLMPYPLPMNFTYQIEIWTKTGEDMDLLRTMLLVRLMSAHAKETFLKATFPFYGEKLMPLQFQRDDDNSDLETGEDERILRHTITATLRGWIFRTPIRRKTIQAAHVAVFDGNPDLDDPELDWYCDQDNYNFSSDGSQLLSINENPAITPPDRTLLTLSFDSTGSIIATGGQP